MALVTPSITYSVDGDRLIDWGAMAAADTVSSAKVPYNYAIAAIMFYNTFGGTVSMNASLDDSTYATFVSNGITTGSTAAALYVYNGQPKVTYLKPVINTGVTGAKVRVLLTPIPS